MRRRFSLFGAIGLLAVALVAPSTVSAGSAYAYRVTQNFCDGDEPNIRVKLIKPEGLRPDKFQIVAQGQHRNIGASRWRNEAGTSTFNKNVPNQNAKFTWAKSILWNPPDNQWHRIKLRLKVIDNGNVVAAETVYSVAC